VLLALLEERPSHGYELIKALEEHSGGFYSPSPGMIYPALTWLEEMSYAHVSAEGAKKLYSITDAGRAYLQENRGAADAMLGQLRWIGRKMGRVREIFGGFDEEEDGGNEGVGAARRELRQALREKRGAPAEEKQRITHLLREAAARIRGTG
jgi:DNA-binding PadR family transcriptional regulator